MFPKASSSLAERSAHAFPLMVIGQSLIETVIASVIIFIEVQAGAQQVEILVIMLRQHQQEGLDHILENTKHVLKLLFLVRILVHIHRICTQRLWEQDWSMYTFLVKVQIITHASDEWHFQYYGINSATGYFLFSDPILPEKSWVKYNNQNQGILLHQDFLNQEINVISC